jgi:hypothetical protein
VPANSVIDDCEIRPGVQHGAVLRTQPALPVRKDTLEDRQRLFVPRLLAEGDAKLVQRILALVVAAACRSVADAQSHGARPELADELLLASRAGGERGLCKAVCVDVPRRASACASLKQKAALVKTDPASRNVDGPWPPCSLRRAGMQRGEAVLRRQRELFVRRLLGGRCHRLGSSVFEQGTRGH